MHFANTTAFANGSSTGTVIANRTHILFGNKPVARINIKKLFVSDKTSRVFHPTQGGHALIANMILYQMAADNAKRLGKNTLRVSTMKRDGRSESRG
jgi:phospholipase/lecithinase/hemolysin